MHVDHDLGAVCRPAVIGDDKCGGVRAAERPSAKAAISAHSSQAPTISRRFGPDSGEWSGMTKPIRRNRGPGEAVEPRRPRPVDRLLAGVVTTSPLPAVWVAVLGR